MKIEIGKRYWRRDGALSGIIEASDKIWGERRRPFYDPTSCLFYYEDGFLLSPTSKSPYDLTDHYIEAYLPAEATKYDQGKLRYDLLPPDALDQITQVFFFGATKYAARNWEGGMAWGRLFAALMRHCWAFWRGEELDSETGYHHLAHAGACVLMLLASVTRGIGKDDRGAGSGR